MGNFFETREIKRPNDDIGMEGKKLFFDRIFHIKDIECSFSDLPEEEIHKKVFGRTEDEFDFQDMKINPETRKFYVKQFLPGNWAELSETQQRKLVVDFAKLLKNELGIQQNQTIVFYKDIPSSCGAYDSERNRIMINTANFDKPDQILNTTAHEMWHAYQHMRAKNPVSEKDWLYAWNFAHYQKPIRIPIGDSYGYVGYKEYHGQLVEAEARAFAKWFVKLEDKKCGT